MKSWMWWEALSKSDIMDFLAIVSIGLPVTRIQGILLGKNQLHPDDHGLEGPVAPVTMVSDRGNVLSKLVELLRNGVPAKDMKVNVENRNSDRAQTGTKGTEQGLVVNPEVVSAVPQQDLPLGIGRLISECREDNGASHHLLLIFGVVLST